MEFSTLYQARSCVDLRTDLRIVVNRTPVVVHAVLILTLAIQNTKTYIYLKHIYTANVIGWKSTRCLVKTKRKLHYTQHHINL